MDTKTLAEIGERANFAIEIINELHTERLNYDSEYLPLINSATDVFALLSEINNLQSAQLKAFNAGYDMQQKHIDETVRQYGNEIDRLKIERNSAIALHKDCANELDRMRKERDASKKALESTTNIKNDYFMQMQSYIKAFRLYQSALELMCSDLLSTYATPTNPENIDLYTKKYIQQAQEENHER